MLAGLLVAVRWRMRHSRCEIFPMPPRYPIANWTGPEVALAMLAFKFVEVIVLVVFHSAGFIPAIDRDTKLEGELLRRLMFVKAVAGPLTVAAMLGVVWMGSRVRPKRIGFRLWRWQRSLYLAYATYIFVTPTVNGINLLANWLNGQVGVQTQVHHLQMMAESDPRPSTLLLVTVVAVVVAPITEEILFRGIMLPWLGRRWWGGWAAMTGAIVLGFSAYAETGTRAPLAFALTMSLLGIAFTFPHAGEQWVRRAIIGTALLFAMMHYPFWPHPVPLFFLGVALGWLAHRSRGLVAPIVLHALFNATSTAVILLAGPAEKLPEEVTKTEARSLPPPPAPTRSALPPAFPAPDGRDEGKPARSPAPAGATLPSS
jgi:membrane protease YdiL (CAAX protease family)